MSSTATETPDSDSLPDEPESVDERKAHALALAAPLDAALIARPLGQPQRYLPRLRTEEQITHPALDLNPEALEKLEGYDEHGHLAAGALEAMRGFHQVTTELIDAREKSKRHPELSGSEAAQVLRVADYADKIWTPASQRGDSASKALAQRIAQAEAELRTGIESGNSHLSAHAGEIRAYCRSLSTEARQKFITGLIADNDTESLAAILRGRQHYLSGLTQQAADGFTLAYNIKHKPERVAQLDFMRRVADKLDVAHRLFVNEQIEGAMGVKHKVVERLRKERAAAAFG